MRILLVEDDSPLARGLKTSLQHNGYAVDWVALVRLAEEAIACQSYQIVVLDLGLPDADGLSLIPAIKNASQSTQVIILTARADTESKVKGLDLGADDYLAKPFDVAELLARIRVLERRIGTNVQATISVDNVTLDTQANSLLVAGSKVDLSRREFMLLKALMENVGRIQSKSNLESKLYEWGEEVSSNTIEVHISNLRKRLPTDFITTVRGVGYMVKPA